MISRRDFLAAAGGALLASACSRGAGERGVVRFGVMANLTHAPALAGLASGRIARALGSSRLETRAFRAGPRVAEALLGGAVDIATAGPAAIVTTHARHPKAFRILAGVCSGGASLVVAKSARVSSASDLRGKALATPQIGSTQDVALRKWLRAQGLETTARGGDVTVHALASSDIRTQLMRGQLAGAWLPEPWPTRVVGEGVATRTIDERTLWPGGLFPTALLVASSAFVEARPDEARAVVNGLREEVRRAHEDARSTEDDAYAEVKRLVTNAGPRALFHDAWSFVDFTDDPLAPAIETFADDAHALGLAPKVACAPLFAPLRA
jgi:NitT/TauT family transport system substrate-binding protein